MHMDRECPVLVLTKEVPWTPNNREANAPNTFTAIMPVYPAIDKAKLEFDGASRLLTHSKH